MKERRPNLEAEADRIIEGRNAVIEACLLYTSLEYVKIPQMEEAIQYITMKLD